MSADILGCDNWERVRVGCDTDIQWVQARDAANSLQRQSDDGSEQRISKSNVNNAEVRKSRPIPGLCPHLKLKVF